ncbi:MAG: hypothetical protein MZV64_31870 [Ignavibacteriales bacterium]|nr:hypothetical protein [Ignavibacteriales bacterium]
MHAVDLVNRLADDPPDALLSYPPHELPRPHRNRTRSRPRGFSPLKPQNSVVKSAMFSS